MDSAPTAASLPFARLAGVGAVVFFANAALLVLQLVASRLLAPFIGSDLYTWTSIIGVFLTGIALGNAYGGKLADRYPSPKTLAAVLLAGAAAAVWMALVPELFHVFYRAIPLGPRIPLLALILCLPAGFVLSLLTPLSIKLGLPDVASTGRVAGMIFALSTLGCLLGNYVTGFYLVPEYTINTLVYFAAGSLFVLAAVVFVVLSATPPAQITPVADAPGSLEYSNPFAFDNIHQAFAVVFLASFCGMTLELAASRIIAEKLGVSLFTWTGIIGVMLAGTALGNLTGGILADRANRPGSTWNPRTCLAGTFILAGGATVLILLGWPVLSNREFKLYTLVEQVLVWTFCLFFLPMFALGMISPQVIRLAVPDVSHAGRVAGRVYAWSTAGAIVGTFAAGYVLISLLTVKGALVAITFVLAGTSLRISQVWKHNLLLYGLAIVMGGAAGGTILLAISSTNDDVLVERETNYYKIKVTREYKLEDDVKTYTGVLSLHLDALLHSSVSLSDPTYIHYEHEHIQMDFLRAARDETSNPKMLVIGGGGYTFPRYAKTVLPETELDVVEIDPGVTRIAYEFLGLKKELGIRDFNMDGRQFVAERAAPRSYDLIVQDAVNDLSVPSHLLTREYNEAVKAALKKDGVYLLTIIDEVEHGKLWRASMATLRESFKHVALLTSNRYMVEEPPPGATPNEVENWEYWKLYWPVSRQVYVIFASDRPLDLERLRRQTEKPPASVRFHSVLVKSSWLDPYLKTDPGIILTDQYAPVDNLMADVFRRRNK